MRASAFESVYSLWLPYMRRAASTTFGHELGRWYPSRVCLSTLELTTSSRPKPSKPLWDPHQTCPRLQSSTTECNLIFHTPDDHQRVRLNEHRAFGWRVRYFSGTDQFLAITRELEQQSIPIFQSVIWVLASSFIEKVQVLKWYKLASKATRLHFPHRRTLSLSHWTTFQASASNLEALSTTLGALERHFQLVSRQASCLSALSYLFQWES